MDLLQAAAIKRHGADGVNGVATLRLLSDRDAVHAQLAKRAPGPVKVYYSASSLTLTTLTSALTDVPAVITGGDAIVELQDGSGGARALRRAYDKGLLLSTEERRRARRKVIVTASTAYGYGGYRTRFTPYKEPQPVILLTYAAPNFEVEGLYDALAPSDDEGARRYVTVLSHDLRMVLRAFDDAVAAWGDGKKGLLKVPGLGLGYFAGAWSSVLPPLLLQAMKRALQREVYPHIAVVELPDFTADGAFTPLWAGTAMGGVQVVSSARDLLLFTDAEVNTWVCGAVVPGDEFALPGNEYGSGSVESMVGDATSLRLDACYVYNAAVLDGKNHVPWTRSAH